MLVLHPLSPVVPIPGDHRWNYIPFWVPPFERVTTKLEPVQKAIREVRIQRDVPYKEELMEQRGPPLHIFGELVHTRLTCCCEAGLAGGRHREEGPLVHAEPSDCEGGCFGKTRPLP